MTIASDGEDTTLAPGALTIAPLRDGDVHTVRAVVERLGPRSRHQRFGKTELQSSDLALFAGVGDGRHVLVARAGSRPVAVAHLVRDGDPSSAEAAVMVADEWQGIGIGTALARRLAVDAAAAGIGRVHALIGGENRASLALMRRATRIVSNGSRARMSSSSARFVSPDARRARHGRRLGWRGHR
jgi:acetyltransferase